VEAATPDPEKKESARGHVSASNPFSPSPRPAPGLTSARSFLRPDSLPRLSDLLAPWRWRKRRRSLPASALAARLSGSASPVSAAPPPSPSSAHEHDRLVCIALSGSRLVSDYFAAAAAAAGPTHVAASFGFIQAFRTLARSAERLAANAQPAPGYPLPSALGPAAAPPLRVSCSERAPSIFRVDRYNLLALQPSLGRLHPGLPPFL
jgi:hypothetical protein